MSTTIDRAEAAKRNMHSHEAQIKNGLTRLGKVWADLDDEGRAALMSRVQAELVGEAEEGQPAFDDSEAIAILTAQKHQKRDYHALLETFRTQAEEASRLRMQATDDSQRRYYAGVINDLNELTRIVEAATKIPEETRTFGCEQLPRNRVSGRNTGFPDIQFRYHTYTTNDPLEVARLLDYMENPKPGDAQIEQLTPGDVAILNSDSGKVIQWANGLQANDIIRRSNNAFRRAFQ